MPSVGQLQPFRFLDLPGEIRNKIYDLLLCTWNHETDQDSNLPCQFLHRKLTNKAIALLRLDKQIHAEASDYMAKRNQFIRITCRGLDVRTLFLDTDIAVVTTSPVKVGRFFNYAMHITLFKPAFTPSATSFSEFEILMLRSDLPNFCQNLDTESIMIDANSSTTEHASLRATIRLNNTCAAFLNHSIQSHLLYPIATYLRGISNLEIQGPVKPAIAKIVIDSVAQPRWSDPQATHEEIGTGVDVGKRQWQQRKYYLAAEAWASAMRTLERMRHSSSWDELQKAGGQDFVNSTADLYFTLNLLHAKFLQVDMSSDEATRNLLQRNGRLSLQHLHNCETASARFAQHAGATWTPTNLQSAKMLLYHARCIRLMLDTTKIIKATTLIEQAALLAPTHMMIRDEKNAILDWNNEFQDTQRMVEDAIIHSADHNPLPSIWSSLWTAIMEMAT